LDQVLELSLYRPMPPNAETQLFFGWLAYSRRLRFIDWADWGSDAGTLRVRANAIVEGLSRVRRADLEQFPHLHVSFVPACRLLLLHRHKYAAQSVQH